MADEVTFSFDMSEIEAGLDSLQQTMVSLTRPAAQVGSQIMYDEVLRRVPVAEKRRVIKSTGRVIEPGTLKRAIYQAYSADNSGPTRATYHISWNHVKAPHGYLVEHGTSRAPAHPFIRPAGYAKKETAQSAMRDFVAVETDKVIAELKK